MEPAKDTKPKGSKAKSLIVLAVIIIAAAAGAYYYVAIPHAPPQFSMTVNPPSFHAAAGGGFILFVQVSRVTGFTSDVNVTLLNPPNWISAPTLNVNSTSINGTLVVPLSQQAVKGSYELTVVGTAQGSADQTEVVSLKVVGVTPLKSPNGSALVYDTTKTLDAATLQALVSFVNGTFQFSQSTSLLDGLQPGDVIAASFNQTPVLPHGFLRTVLAVHQQNGGVSVDTQEASLTEAAQDITFGTRGSSGVGSSGTSVSSLGPRPENVIDACNSISCYPLYSQTWQPFGANGQNLGGDANLYVGATLQISLGGGGHISWSGIDWVVLGLFGHEEAKATLKGSAGDQFNWHNDDIQTLYTKDIGIIPPILNVHIELDLAGRAFGTLLENVNTGLDQTYDLVLAVTDNANSAPASIQTYCSSGGWNLCAKSIPSFSHSMTISPPRNPGSSCSSGPAPAGDCARIEIGPRLTVGIDGTIEVASVSGGAFLEADMFLELDNQAQGVPVWSLYIGLTGSAGFKVSAGFNYPCGAGCDWHGCWISTCYASVFSFDPNPPWTLGDFYRQDIWDAGNLPPPTPTLIIPNSADIIDLSNPAFLNPNMFSSWATLSGVEPEGEVVTCIWQTAELGQLGTSNAAAAGNSLICHGPGGSFPVEQLNKIISQGLHTITVTVIAEDSAGEKSSPSNAVTVTLRLPVPTLQIQQYFPNQITQGQPFTIIGTAKMSTVISSSYPNGVIDFCATAPQRLGWAVGGYYSSDLGGWVDGYNDPNTVGSSCTAQMIIPTAGSNTINFFLVTADGTDLVKDNQGNPIVASITVNVLPAQVTQTTQSAQGGAPLVVTITTPPNAYPATINPSSYPIQLSGTVTGGTPPYTVTWFAVYTWNGPQIATIVTGGANDLNYAWTACPTLGSTAGTATILLKATDANGATGQSPTSVTITFNCEVIQSFPPLPVMGTGMGLVSLLTVLFAITGERLIPIVLKDKRVSAFPRSWYLV